MPTTEELEEIEEAALTLRRLIDTVEEGRIAVANLQLQRAQLWENLAGVHKQRAEWYFSLLHDAKVYIGQMVQDNQDRPLPHGVINFHNKLAALEKIIEDEKK